MKKYKFVITQFDEKKETMFIATLTTKAVTPARAGELLRQELGKYSGKNYCFHVMQGGSMVAAKDLK